MPPSAHHLLRRSLSTGLPRHATAASKPPKKSGSIADVFSSLSGAAVAPLPAQYAKLKRELWRDGMAERWAEVLAALEQTTTDIQAAGPEVGRAVGLRSLTLRELTSCVTPQIVPRLPFEQIKRGEVDPEIIRRIKETGTVIVEGVQSEQVRSSRLRSIQLALVRLTPHLPTAGP